MPITMIYGKPDTWPFVMGETILGVSPGSPPDILYVFDDKDMSVRLVATKAAEPTHKVRISNVGGFMGTGSVSKNPIGAGHLLIPLSGAWSTRGFQSVQVPATVDVGNYDISLEWDSQQTATVEQREKEHVADLERAYEITWKVIEEALQKLQHNKYHFNVVLDPEERVEYRNRSLYKSYVDESNPNKPRFTQDFADNYMDRAPFTNREAFVKGLKEYSSDLDFNYKQEKLSDAKNGALLRALNDLIVALPKKLWPVSTAQFYEMRKSQAQAHWHRVFTETAEKTRQRDINNEHSGTFEYSRHQNNLIFLKRVPSTKPSTPTNQLISL